MPRDENCTKCPLHTRVESVCIWERGTMDDQRVMVVGEAPGSEEDRQGLPFVGPSGERINNALAKAGITSPIFTNAVKCAPWGTPKSEPIRECSPYLWEQIEAHRPKFILALGNIALRTFMPGNITALAGREFWHERAQAWVYPALHPAATLYDVNKLEGWENDIARFGKLVQGAVQEKPPVKVGMIRTADKLRGFGYQLQEWTRSGRPVTIDFESRPHLQGTTHDKKKPVPWWSKEFLPYSVAFGLSPFSSVVVPLGHPESPLTEEDTHLFFREIRPYFDLAVNNLAGPLIYHNVMYDGPAWFRAAGYLPRVDFDTMVAAHLLDENRPKSLKYLGRSLLNWPNWDVDASKEHPLETLYQYNGWDTAATFHLWKLFQKQLLEAPHLNRYYDRLEIPKLRALLRLVTNGMYLDENLVYQRLTEAIARKHKAAEDIPVDNPGSTVQLQEWLYDRSDLPVLKYTPGGSPSTDQESIALLALEGHNEARIITEYRRYARYESTYLGPWYHQNIGKGITKRLHPEIRVTGTETGRLASPEHTVPRDGFVRGVVSAPPGHTLVSGDFSQIEARLAAWRAAGCPASWHAVDSSRANMLLAWAQGRDVYKETAGAALGKRPEEVTDDKNNPQNERQVMGKVPTLAMLYGIGASGLRSYAWREFEIVWTETQAKHIWGSFYRRWPEFRYWHEYERKTLPQRGFAISAIGRIRRLPAAMEPDSVKQREAVNSGINMPIQSLASEMTQAALILMDRWIQKRAQGQVRIVHDVHDALLVETTNDMLLQVKQVLEFIMTRAALDYLKPLGLELPEGLIRADIKAGPWGG